MRSRYYSPMPYVSDIPGLINTIGSIVEAYKRIDILVNNAGILSKESIETITEEQWDRVMSINVKSAAFASGTCIKHMIRQRFGRIINISSMAARMGGISAGCAYSASKAALIGLTRDIAKKYAKYGITANAIAPGTTKGEMSKGFTRQELEDLVAGIPVGFLTDPGDIAKTVVFLSQDTAKSITGAVIDINGGSFMG